MMDRTGRNLLLVCLLGTFPAWAGPVAETRPVEGVVEGVWKLEQIVRPTGAIRTEGGFIFAGGYYSTTVTYAQMGTQTNISQFGNYAVEGNRLMLVPMVHVSTRGQTVIYDPEPPFTLEVTLTGDEMKGVAVKDGTTFVFRRLR
jgi:hypothetical protein